jgi:ribosomal-protein-alanine N-acetyltransferase
MHVFIETERLIFREIVFSDKEGMFALDRDPEVHKYLGNLPVRNREETEDIIKYIRQQYADNGIGRWAIIDKSSGDFVGWGGFKLVKELINGHSNYYDLGYRFIRKYWGRGFATESAIASIHYGFENLNLNEIYAFTEKGNEGSVNVLEKAGMRFIEQFDYKGDEHSWFEIKRIDWANRQHRHFTTL